MRDVVSRPIFFDEAFYFTQFEPLPVLFYCRPERRLSDSRSRRISMSSQEEFKRSFDSTPLRSGRQWEIGLKEIERKEDF